MRQTAVSVSSDNLTIIHSNRCCMSAVFPSQSESQWRFAGGKLRKAVINNIHVLIFFQPSSTVDVCQIQQMEKDAKWH